MHDPNVSHKLEHVRIRLNAT